MAFGTTGSHLFMESAAFFVLLAVFCSSPADAYKFMANRVIRARADPATPAAAPAPAPAVSPYSQVTAVPYGQNQYDKKEAATSKKYLIATFPNLKQVAYCQLPDNVWRPLVVGDVSAPQGLAVDVPNNRLYVADPVLSKVFWYDLLIRPDGKLMTGAKQYVALEGYTVSWMSINGIGDLYFTGHAVVTPPQSAYDSVWRQDAKLIALGNTLSPTEVYSRSNSGAPNPKVWMPSGIAVDSFFIYWGNQELGTTYGAVCKGSRQNIMLQASEMSITALNTALSEVRGMTSTGNALYYLTPQGVYGMAKTQSGAITDASQGLVAGPPSGDTNSQAFDPKSIAWDGDGTAYFTDFTTGVVYSIPVMDFSQHNLTKFVDAPGVYGMAVANFEQSSSASKIGSALCFLLLVLRFA